MKNTYLIAYIDSLDYIRPLDTGERYSATEARQRADDLNQTCQAELIALNGKAFVSLNTEAL